MPETRAAQRHKPSQARARETRERILDSAAQLFSAHGMAEVSTNRIAAHAHMSIGALYRYFDDKAAIAEVLRARLLAELEECFTAAVIGSLGLPVRESVATSLRIIMGALVDRRHLVRALAADATVEGIGFGGLERRLLLLTRAYLLQQLGPLPDDELDIKAFVMVNAGLAASLRIALQPPAGLDVDGVISETATMLGEWLGARS
ncbi:TetR/AcrR family transcriptional regulator [Nocardia acidivorans]|uniref:TetR/AcrR family transcriptional regulator n=1 Tax=Nocardia acidivorans TaxID=404580 RepID=UPI0008346D40|nr:TetR/AcrR family transcriptional regulator [Nocardia acidivorans]